MNISYTEPLSRSWERMKSMLFRPFQIETWFVVGFSEFLAGLFGHTGSLAKLGNPLRSHGSHPMDVRAEQALDRVRDAVLKMLENPMVLAAIMAGVILLLMVGVALAWVSARAEFVFIDNVAHRRARITEPWRRFGRLGHSLFLWRAVFSFAFILPLAFMLVPFAGTMMNVLHGGPLALPRFAAMAIGIGCGAAFAAVLAWWAWTMDTFVVPLMYRYDENATQAWARFWPLLRGRPGSFFAFTVFYVVVAIAAGIAAAIVGFGTCCIGLVLMIIPYIGNVVLLPLTLTSRALGPEFLAQFGPEWVVFPPAIDDDEPVAPPQPPTTQPVL